MERTDNTTNVSTFENFPLSRITQEKNSKSTNVINAINRLLNMYHSEDGIAAYERVLKTLLLLSENFDSNTQQQIISMVPLPKGATSESIKDVIYKTTGLIEVANNMYQKSNVVPKDKLCTEIATEKSRLHLNQNVMAGLPTQNLKLDENFVPSVPEVFRGFPPNEISTIHSHVRNVNYVYDTLDYNIPCIESCIDARQNYLPHSDQQEGSLKHQSNLKLKWIHTPHLVYKKNSYQITTPSYQESFFNSIDDKCFQLPIDKVNNYNQWNLPTVSHMLQQNHNGLKKKLCDTSKILNIQDKTEILNFDVPSSGTSLPSSGINCCEFLYNNGQDFKNYNININESKICKIETRKRFEPELKSEQQAIQEDIYKMDVVTTEDNFTLDNFIVDKKLETSLQNFLKRADQEILIELPIFSHIKPPHTIPPAAKCRKFVTQKNLENKNQLDSLINNANNYKNPSLPKSMKKLGEKKTTGLLSVYPKSTQLQVLQKNLNIASNDLQSVKCEKKDSVENLPYKSAVKQTEQNNVNILQKTASVTELAIFKKHYYDTLLNIQKAKVAVANSLATSSVESSTKYDPYYSSRSYQQQQLLQQHGQLTVNPQFAAHTVAQSGLSNIHNASYTWMRYNDWRHPTVRQLRLPRQVRY
ncbi:PREDICTED: uncharacterized protein LOC107191774 [Dufourea novaeangliae]|uniref:uncharacterized protein LOC107191774 n=1 Tax=Dufourea novaeangliae TaxID=178035 RepID=UPI00076750FA|nr:PREDICTED: uncharacterized protein LOC107191774 [Dufourea novaeangliae]